MSVSCKSAVSYSPVPGTTLLQSQHDPANGMSMQLVSKESSKLISIFSSASSVLSLYKASDSGVLEEVATANIPPYAVCFDWDPSTGAVLVGHSNGAVALYQVAADKKAITQSWSTTTSAKLIKSVGLMDDYPAVFVSAEQKLFTLSRDSGQLLSGKLLLFTLETIISVSPDAEIMGVSVHNQICLTLSKCGKLFVYSMKTSPPLYESSIPISGSILLVDWHAGIVFVADAKAELLHILALENLSGDKKLQVTLACSLPVGKTVSSVCFWRERNEIYLGYTNGVIAVIAMRLNPPTLIYASKHHETEVCKLSVDNVKGVIISQGKGGSVIALEPPLWWMTEELLNGPIGLAAPVKSGWL